MEGRHYTYCTRGICDRSLKLTLSSLQHEIVETLFLENSLTESNVCKQLFVFVSWKTCGIGVKPCEM